MTRPVVRFYPAAPYNLLILLRFQACTGFAKTHKDANKCRIMQLIGHVSDTFLTREVRLCSLYGVPCGLVQKCSRLTGLESVTLHTARHGFASVAPELGYSEVTIAGLLGHRSSSVTGRYIHLVDPALIARANAVSGLIDSRMGEAEIDNGNVVEIGTHAPR